MAVGMTGHSLWVPKPYLVFQVIFTQEETIMAPAEPLCPSHQDGPSLFCVPAYLSLCTPEMGALVASPVFTPLPCFLIIPRPWAELLYYLGSQSALEIRRHSLLCFLGSVCIYSERRVLSQTALGCPHRQGLEGKGALGPVVSPCALKPV